MLTSVSVLSLDYQLSIVLIDKPLLVAVTPDQTILKPRYQLDGGHLVPLTSVAKALQQAVDIRRVFFEIAEVSLPWLASKQGGDAVTPTACSEAGIRPVCNDAELTGEGA